MSMCIRSRVRGQRCTLYLAGTCHVVTDDQVPFPSPFYVAYEDSKEVHREADGGPSGFAMIRLMFKMLKWAGKHGDLQLLRNAGYAPEQMYGVDRPGCAAGE